MKDKYVGSQNNKGMLKYSKIILRKVSFDMGLFEKELKKSIKHLVGQEVEELKKWCMRNFKGPYQAIISDCFAIA